MIRGKNTNYTNYIYRRARKVIKHMFVTGIKVEGERNTILKLANIIVLLAHGTGESAEWRGETIQRGTRWKSMKAKQNL